jgi:hypothetical protein
MTAIISEFPDKKAPRVVPELVEYLEILTKMAESGEIQSVALSMMHSDGASSGCFIGDVCDNLFIEFDRLKLKYLMVEDL